MLKAKDLRDKSDEELQMALEDTQKELYKLKDERKLTKKLDKPHLLRTKQKDIARILTVQTEKKKA